MFQFNNKTIKQYINKCRGMTLIEVLVVVAIILILLGAVVINPRPSVDLDRAARQLASDLRDMQNKAMAVDIGEDPIHPTSACYGVKVLGPLIYTRYFYRGTSSLDPCSILSGYEDTILPKGFTFISPLTKSISFLTPNGAVCINDDPFDCCCSSASSESSIDFIIQAPDGFTRTVTVTSAGKIEIQ